ncbi:hypothetical protein EGW08_013599 [Elysia chlorotica]|uniref:Beta-glucuronidase n=1 Tax=Elysia chlorotica TaxID=188477 RepID=A0A3S1B2Y0_ELYCH|nr:hypothetical protein EGW08_013599 [Elysia chlorotica]
MVFHAWEFTCIVFLSGMLLHTEAAVGMLYPRDSESRESKLLDGIWHFRADMSPTRAKGFDEMWWSAPLCESGPVIDMPVPASYNDITEDKALRDFVGWVWYDRQFYVSPAWSKNWRVVLRFDSAHYYSIVWVNGKQVLEHTGGHLPFEADVFAALRFDGPNRITVAVNNTLTPTTLPPGEIQYENDTSKYPEGYFAQVLQMDFFNYAGIHRHVRLYTTPRKYIDDITILTNVVGNKGQIKYTVVLGGEKTSGNDSVQISALDTAGRVVASGSELNGALVIPNPQLWWPYGMNDTVGYQYTLMVNCSGDVYRQPFGIRTVRVTEDQFLINDKPFYCHGVAKHEDSDIRGKGLDYALITKDFNMLRWLGVNCIRTSHYPYAEEIMSLADQQGVAVIDESPGVGIKHDDNMGPESLKHHKEVMTEMIQRDKNRPSVIMWSVANEPASKSPIAEAYFKSVIEHTRSEDPASRPITFAGSVSFEEDTVVQFVDVVCINRYYGWYEDPGHLEIIPLQLHREFEGFRAKQRKPIIVTEYGADTVPGLHREPSFMFTEEYQVDLLQETHKVFDAARQKYLVGEMVWNFADFMTVEGVKRVVGNKKGLLTRQRQPKRAAFTIRDRYHALATGQDTRVFYQPSHPQHTGPHMYSVYSQHSHSYQNYRNMA